MPYRCTKCNITWAVLHSQDDEHGDEQYWFCPKCKNDAHLVMASEGETHIMCLFTGKIKNITTGKYLEEKVQGTYKPEKRFDQQAWEKKKAARQEKEELALKAYLNAYDIEGREAAEKKYWAIMKSDL